jgi:uncharacterized RDD family membrane protein YckC
MRCPSCGAVNKKRSMKCTECGASRSKRSVKRPRPAPESPPPIAEEATQNQPTQEARAKSNPSLIEFPGAGISIPQWRKELGERVREVQERRAREAMLEATQPESTFEEELAKAPMLELLPQADVQPVNPLVAAALERIERAHAHAQFSGNAAVATVVDYHDQREFALNVEPSTADNGSGTPQREMKHNLRSIPSERVHNLAVVPTPEASRAEAEVANKNMTSSAVTNEGENGEKAKTAQVTNGETTRKPKRLIIGDPNDPALNYLDSIPTALRVDRCEKRSAPMFFRILSAIVDMVVICLLSSPVVALVNLGDLNWEDLRVIGFAAGTFLVMGFLYLTISTAFTGRTLGMRLFSLRVVDARTGLIPTGTQSAARALVYMLSLASAGLLLMYMFLDPEKHTAHDRFARTVVVKV